MAGEFRSCSRAKASRSCRMSQSSIGRSFGPTGLPCQRYSNRLPDPCRFCRGATLIFAIVHAVRGTLAAIEHDLIRDGYVLRYHTSAGSDGLPPGEGVFLACSFWLTDNYVLQGRYNEARELFERLLSPRNDVGLLAEEYDPVAKRQLRNFPQAFSHLALINTAHNLLSANGAVHQRSARN